MIFSASNDGIEWSLDFGPDSVTLTVENLVQEMTICSQENPLAAWSLLLSQRQEFLNNHLAPVPVTPNQRGTHEMKDEILSSVGAQDMDTSRYQVSAADLDDVEFYWENDWLDMDVVFITGIDTPFSTTAFDILEMRGSAENPNLLDEEEDKENCPPTTPVSERPTHTSAYLRSRPFGTRIEVVVVYVYGNLFQYVLPCLCFKINYHYRVSMYHNFFSKIVRHVSDKSSCSIDIINFISSSSKFPHISSPYREKIGTPKQNQKSWPLRNEYKK